jgi:hypothetical protein
MPLNRYEHHRERLQAATLPRLLAELPAPPRIDFSYFVTFYCFLGIMDNRYGTNRVKITHKPYNNGITAKLKPLARMPKTPRTTIAPTPAIG